MERTTDTPAPGPSPAREDRYSTQEKIPPDPSTVEDKPFTCISLCNDSLGYRPPISPAQGDR